MKDTNLFSPKDAAPILGLSVATITRCVKAGAPVHRWGSTGRRYRIDVDEFRRWMERQGPAAARPALSPWDNVDELARRRRASVRGVI